ncbi:aspartyl-tRNA(Asn) amidotransferase subunit A/ glutamyl-tRNA(Gln) amidotransferase subunit A [Melissococcus plutonius ATCC 35311]|uniref:Glutamyl-tRNA(Gln) amidotransferase subunit A n=1 Tax=Melissococcus plutonius (strain ATCC 35311 / DSM 29964 / CIP 104052 / LMG 20360 / NCIMB 702443) TaxID=940190 RepID=F3Y9F3_MELPT|nr:Asp-tRNA(Asn)/Glu-tRNA(Gln) amidotransferase subunit GatA [Melissococcus plutonius]KMT40466.1 glutamyl-tRNA(Gln) amidotransferase subunit A [Melissococcus plutonius]MBB5177095.1 aspartyl-tRNA(Asn)/glutamyl-tRNA(Gln) amidotransferase subunit A [Melissococcus plutonius]BAK21131.1 aspartyl-tRNA(Asn) amidotransferase subunit A/ glutamyl-tRNA(Gln) amidotransferase subunit A [Melissococcus plutonius ATCC 35311]
MTKLYDKSVTELHDLLISKEITAQDLTKETLDRIKETDDKIDAFITVSEEKALELAKFVDKKGITESNFLAGIPVGVKDNIITKDILTTAASKILYNFKPNYDATVMDKMYQADMIPIGKLNMDEFAMGGSSETSYFKNTKNAWDQTKVPGGSSGGSAAAVAAGQIPVSLGSDTGGSIRQPAAFNGVVGLKPTYGRISRFGLIAFASSLDQIGPITRNVKDNALVLNTISGYDKRDSTSAGRSVPDFTEGLTGDIKGMKIALPKEYIGEGVDREVCHAIEKAAETLRDLGATVEEVSLPHSKSGVAVYYIVASSEASSNLQRYDGIRYGYRSENSKDLEDLYIHSRSEGFGDEVKRRIMLGTFALSASAYDACYKKAGQVRTLIKQDFDKVFEEYDLIIGPTTPTVAFGLKENFNQPISMYMSDILTIPVNLAGLPGMSIPAGFSEGLPIGLQIIGKHFDEKTMYKAAYAFEQATNFYKEKPAILGGKD